MSKVKVAFIQADGIRVETMVESGTTGMQAARQSDVIGIEAECGGSAACATCHVYVDTSFLSKLAALEMQEDQILEFTACERRLNSRLSCQIPLTTELDGIVFTIPDRQS